MGNKYSRAGGKFTGNHTTLTPLACWVCDLANESPEVTSISPGFLKAGLPPANGNRKVKILKDKGGLLLAIRDSTSHQEVRVYASDVQKAMFFIACGCRDADIRIAFK